MAVTEETFDFIVCGAGSAGCAVAGRLSESGRHSVLLLEAGPEDKAFWIGVPMGFPMLFTNPKVNWMFESEPVAALEGRRMYQPRGKVLGGTSAINGMVYIRGQAEDYDLWRQKGCVGWSFEDVLPFFKKAENQVRGADDYHGVGGPLTVSDYARPCELSQAFIEAAQQAGIPLTTDFNGPSQEGVGYYQTTTSGARRMSAAGAYLAPARSRQNLVIATNAHLTRVVIEDGRAVGVEYRIGERRLRADARREIVLSGGAFGSPQMLQLSGVGPAEHLRSVGVTPILDRPEVGANLMDHFQTSLAYRCKKPVTMNDVVNNPIRRLAAGLEYVLFKSGPLSTNGIHAGIFTQSAPGVERPDIQIHIGLWSAGGARRNGLALHSFSGFTLSPVHLNPVATGTVRLKSSDPLANPEIRQNFFEARSDVDALIASLRIARAVASQPALAPYVAGEITPGPAVKTDAEAEAYLRATATANLHPVGSCRMGGDEGAVVDPRLRVRGVTALRIADASIMPTLPAGNTNAPSIMIGEKAAAMILEDAR
jgi:choline dehydrogenase